MYMIILGFFCKRRKKQHTHTCK